MSKITESARDEMCQVRFWWVNYHPNETVVFAHSNKQKHGKGMGIKAKDEHGAYACYRCHAIYDGLESRPSHISKEEIDAQFEIGMARTKKLLIQKGLL